MSIYFWLDNWVEDISLENLGTGELDLVKKHTKVSDYWDDQSGWRWDYFEGKLPCAILDKITTILVADDLSHEDGFYWGCQRVGIFQ